MPAHISTSKGFLVLSAAALLALTAMLLPRFHHDPYAELQTRNLAIAERYVRTVSPLLRQDEKFRDVKVSIHTGADGSVVIDGQVASDAELTRLSRSIQQSHPGVIVFLQIRVGSDERLVTSEIHPDENRK